MELVDTHCHLFSPPLLESAAEVLERAADAGVAQVVVPCYDRDSWPLVVDLAREHAATFAAFGVHPWVADRAFSPDRLRELLGWGRSAWVRAVGEVGLDYALPNADPERQREVLGAQLDLALEHDLPVILHCRDAVDDLEAMVRERPGLRGVVHGLSRGPELALRFVALGFYVGLGPLVTRQGAHRVRQAAVELPLDKILLETDAPKTAPADLPEGEGEPAHVARVAEAVSELRGVEVEQIASQTTENARSLFRLP